MDPLTEADKFEFYGRTYCSRDAAFHAQKYSDQPNIMKHFSECTDVGRLIDLLANCTITEKRKASWEDSNVVHYNKYAIEKHLERELLRHLYKRRCQSLVEAFPKEIWENISSHLDKESLLPCSYVNKRLHLICSAYITTNLFHLCPTLAIVDTGSGEIPPFNPLKTLRWINKLAPEVGLDFTLLIMRQGLSFTKLLEMARENGVAINLKYGVSTEINDKISVDRTYVALFPCNFFKQPIGKDFFSQTAILGKKGCTMVSLLEIMALCIFKKGNFETVQDKDGNQSSVHVRTSYRFGRITKHIKWRRHINITSKPNSIDVFSERELGFSNMTTVGRRVI